MPTVIDTSFSSLGSYYQNELNQAISKLTLKRHLPDNECDDNLAVKRQNFLTSWKSNQATSKDLITSSAIIPSSKSQSIPKTKRRSLGKFSSSYIKSRNVPLKC